MIEFDGTNIQTKNKIYTPSELIYISLSLSNVCNEILDMNNIEDVHKFVEGIKKYQSRFTGSC